MTWGSVRQWHVRVQEAFSPTTGHGAQRTGIGLDPEVASPGLDKAREGIPRTLGARVWVWGRAQLAFWLLLLSSVRPDSLHAEWGVPGCVFAEWVVNQQRPFFLF